MKKISALLLFILSLLILSTSADAKTSSKSKSGIMAKYGTVTLYKNGKVKDGVNRGEWKNKDGAYFICYGFYDGAEYDIIFDIIYGDTAYKIIECCDCGPYGYDDLSGFDMSFDDYLGGGVIFDKSTETVTLKNPNRTARVKLSDLPSDLRVKVKWY